MAELHVQRKERTVWPWILAAIVVVALLFWFLRGRGDNRAVGMVDGSDSAAVGFATDTNATGRATGMVAGTAMTQYLQFVNARASRASGVAHDYTADGLRKLTAAMNEIAGGDSVGGVALQPRIDEIRQRADAMQQNPNSSEHARQTREAFTMASDLMEQLNSNRGNAATGDLDALQKAATAVQASRPLLDQTDLVEQFFEQAGEALRLITGTTR